jgi:hypothetical protein
MEHHDPTGVQKNIKGTPATIDEIIVDSTSVFTVKNFSMIRLANTTANFQFVWVGKIGDEPVAVDITTGIAIAPNSCETFYVGFSDDVSKSLAAKTSSALVQAVKISEEVV